MSSSSAPGDDQIWFFLRESMSSDKFTLKQLQFSDIRKKKPGLTLRDCLNLVGSKGDLDDYAFYIHCASMTAAVRLLSDESLEVTYKLYCRGADVVTITIRRANEPSPNSTRAPSHNNSLAARRKVTEPRGRVTSEVFIQPATRHASGSIDIVSGEVMIQQEEMVTIDVGGGDFVTLNKDYLTLWIEACLREGKALTDMVLSEQVWQRSLIRGSSKDTYLPYWNAFTTARLGRESVLSEIATNVGNFPQDCQNFIHDLRVYGTDMKARARLDKTGHEFYLGEPYFSDRVVRKLLSIPTQSGTLSTDLRNNKGQAFAKAFAGLKVQDTNVAKPSLVKKASGYLKDKLGGGSGSGGKKRK
ncbi:hypothetical protein KVT40_006725 [Elsinoe batatas]|uniref:Uncharacterized protein n=1 Tax=Elsinoe batatas TaxID=2601811 RepID=A0A8K0PGW2_9PEZI|nr:hypothetical protein KVT40_006725 [Elsinoe batatas]